MLNPDAPAYIPLSSLTLDLPFHSHGHALPSTTVITSLAPCPFPSQLIPACIPLGIPLQIVPGNCSFLPPVSTQPSSAGFLSLPPPPLPDVPPPSDSEKVIIGRKGKRSHKHPTSCYSWKGGSQPWSRRKYGSFTVACKDRGGFGNGGGGCGGGILKPNGSFDLRKHDIMPLKHDEKKTTVMIKNIPYEFTRSNLVEFLDKHCMAENQEAKEEGSREEDGIPSLSAYDFLYLPIDFEKKKNKGYAFVNFTEPRAVWKFFNAFNATRWDCNNSLKIRKIVCARIQGKEALVKHFEKTYFDCESDEFLPACFTPPRDGSGASVEVTTVARHRGGTSHQNPH